MSMSIADAESLLRGSFAPWIQDMGIRFDGIGPGEAVLRVPPSERLYRAGGTFCGQAIMALADTALVFAVSSLTGGLVPMTTVSLNTTFLRPATPGDLIAAASIIRKGRSIIYGEVNLHGGDAAKPVAHVTSTYMLL